MTDRESGEAFLSGLALAVILLVGAGGVVGYWLAPTPVCPAPDYDVDRVVKMHEESRKCAAELEEAQDAIRICGRLLKGALE